MLSDEEKRKRVVLKRVNLDTWGVRTDFLRSGTMARGAAETGKVRNRKQKLFKSELKQKPKSEI